MVSKGRSGRTSPSEFIERLKFLIANNAAESERLLTRFSALVREANQAVSRGRAGERPSADELLSRWLDFNLASYSVVSTQSVALLNGLLSAAQSTLIPKAVPVPDKRATAAPRVKLQLSGRPGERATTGFVIENQFDRPLNVSFESAALLPMTTGPELPASLVSFEPATLAIPPRGQGVVQVAVMITADFVAGETYTTTISPLGFEAKELEVSLLVLPPAQAVVPS
jgi:hypothetical protein